MQKNQIDQLKDLYKALLYIEEKMQENRTKLEFAYKSLDQATNIFQNARLEGIRVIEEFQQITKFGFDWLESNREKYVVFGK